MAAWGDTSEEEDGSQDEEEAVALIARSGSNSDSNGESLKKEVRNLGKKKLEKLIFSLLEEYEPLTSENCMLKHTGLDLEKDVKRLERTRQELEHMNEALMYEKLEINEKALALSKELDTLKHLSDKKEEELNTKIRELESESSKLRHNLESQINDNRQLREQVQRAETDFTENRS